MKTGIVKYCLILFQLVVVICVFCFHLQAQESSVTNAVGKEPNVHNNARLNLCKAVFEKYRYSNQDTSYVVLSDGLKYFSNNSDISSVADILCMLAQIDADRGAYSFARRKLLDAASIYDKLGHGRGVAITHNLIGVVEGKSGNYDRATEHFLEALKRFQGFSDSLGMLNAYMNLGFVRSSMGDLDKSMEYNLKAQSMFSSEMDIRTKCNLYNNIGIIYGMKGDLDNALAYFQKALDGSDKQTYIDVYLYSLLNFGIVYQKFNNLKKALSYFEEALAIAREKKLPEEEARLLQNIGGVYDKIDLHIALDNLNNALAIANRINNKGLTDDIYQEMIEVYRKMNNYKEMVSLMEVERALRDSLGNVEKAKQIASLESVFELEQSNNNLKQLQLKELANLQKRNVLWVAVISLLVIMLIVLLSYRKTRALNYELKKQKEALAASNSMKDHLFSVIGHDLRGPVGNINMVLDILDDVNTTPEERNFMMQALRGQSQATLETLETLLYWGKSQINKTGINPKKLNVLDTLQKNMRLLNFSAASKNIEVQNKIPADVFVLSDTDQFDFVLRNLLSNAIKFTPQGGSVTLTADRQSLPGYAVITVRDTGIGLTAEQIDSVFKPIIKSSPGTDNEKGTGIGLMLCHEFVKQNGGRIWVESEVGKGAAFFVAFKLG